MKRATQVVNPRRKENNVDKKIRSLEKGAEKEVKGLKKLESMDKKRDKVCAMGEKAMKAKKK